MIRLRCTHNTTNGDNYNIFIYDRDLEASTTDTFDAGPELFTIKWDGDRQDPFKRIVPSSCKFTVLMKRDADDFDLLSTFYDDLVNSKEGRFYVRIIKLLPLGSETVFLGKVLVDTSDKIIDYIEEFTIQCIDGLTDLKNIEYRPIGYVETSPEWAGKTITFVDHFIDILTRLDVVTYFNDAINWGNTVLLTTSGNWTESQSVAGDIFNQVRVRNYWFEQKTPTYRKYKSCYDVLEELLTGFNARIYSAKGHFHVEQLGYQDNPTDELVIYGYNFDGNAMAGTYYEDKVQHNIDSDDTLLVGTGVSVRRLPTFKAIELTQAREFHNYINGMNINWPGNPGPHVLGAVLGDSVKIITSLNALISFEEDFNPYLYFVGPDDFTQYVFIVEYQIKVGSYYFEPYEENLTDGFTDIRATTARHWEPIVQGAWTLTPTTIKVRYESFYLFDDGHDMALHYYLMLDRFKTIDLIMESEELPVQDEELSFEIVDVIAKIKYQNTETVMPSPTYFIRKTSRIIAGPNGYQDLYELPDSITVYEVGDVNNTLVYELNLGYFDEPNLLLMRQLWIGSPISVPTVEWTDPDSPGDLPIQKLVSKQMLAMRATPNNTWSLPLMYSDDTPIYFRDTIVIKDKVHIPIEMEMIGRGPGGYTTYNTIMWEVFKDFDGVNIVDTGEGEVDQPLPLPFDYDAESPGTPVETYYEEWSGVTADYVDSVTSLDYYFVLSLDPVTIRGRVRVYVDGIKYRYVDANGLTFPLTPGDLLPNEFTVDVATNRIYFPLELSSSYVEFYFIKT